MTHRGYTVLQFVCWLIIGADALYIQSISLAVLFMIQTLILILSAAVTVRMNKRGYR